MELGVGSENIDENWRWELGPGIPVNKGGRNHKIGGSVGRITALFR